jgi:hypothetical protein
VYKTRVEERLSGLVTSASSSEFGAAGSGLIAVLISRLLQYAQLICTFSTLKETFMAFIAFQVI